MPPKQAETFGGLNAKEAQHLGTMMGLMNDLPEIDWEEFARRINVKYAKNAKSGMKKIFDKLKKSVGVESEAEEETEETDKKPAKKAATKKASTKKTEATPEQSEEEAPEPAAKKKKAAAPKKAAATKKTVGKTSAPKKASEGGPKAAKPRGKGKKAEADDDDAEAEVAASSADEKPEKLVVEGKSTVSHILSQLKTISPPAVIATASAPVIFPTPLTMMIDGVLFTYTRKDIKIAESHDIPLSEFLKWKQYNDYSTYVDEDDDSDEEPVSSAQGVTQNSDKV